MCGEKMSKNQGYRQVVVLYANMTLLDFSPSAKNYTHYLCYYYLLIRSGRVIRERK